jgi:2-methylcitrate dehydratase PrpD
MFPTDRLAAFAAELRYEDLPEAMRVRARMAVLDALAIMLGAVDFARGNGDHELETYLRLVAPQGPATVVGLGRKTSPMLAAFAGGVLCEVLDCSDCNLTARIHNGPAIVPTVLALAEAEGATGREAMTALIAGYEIGTRLGHAIQPAHWYRGFQITGTMNTPAAAATAARLLGLDAAGIAAAIGIGGFIMPVSNGDNVFNGHSAKPIHGGQPALCGISAAYLAQAGYRAGPLEGEPPRYHAALHVLSDGKPDLERMLAGLGERWVSEELAFKPYPIGLLNVAPVEICLIERAERDIDPAKVEAVEVGPTRTPSTLSARNTPPPGATSSTPISPCRSASPPP